MIEFVSIFIGSPQWSFGDLCNRVFEEYLKISSPKFIVKEINFFATLISSSLSIWACIFLLPNTSEVLCLLRRVIRYFVKILWQSKANCFPYSCLIDLPMAKCHVISNYFQVIITSLSHLASHCLNLYF